MLLQHVMSQSRKELAHVLYTMVRRSFLLERQAAGDVPSNGTYGTAVRAAKWFMSFAATSILLGHKAT
jgi:hypothetical protein